MKTYFIEVIGGYLRGEEDITGDRLVRTFTEEPDKLTKVEAEYTERSGKRLQLCQTCDHYAPNGKNWGDCEKVQEAVWCLAHCRYWVMTGGRQKLRS